MVVEVDRQALPLPLRHLPLDEMKVTAFVLNPSTDPGSSGISLELNGKVASLAPTSGLRETIHSAGWGAPTLPNDRLTLRFDRRAANAGSNLATFKADRVALVLQYEPKEKSGGPV